MKNFLECQPKNLPSRFLVTNKWHVSKKRNTEQVNVEEVGACLRQRRPHQETIERPSWSEVVLATSFTLHYPETFDFLDIQELFVLMFK